MVLLKFEVTIHNYFQVHNECDIIIINPIVKCKINIALSIKIMCGSLHGENNLKSTYIIRGTRSREEIFMYKNYTACNKKGFFRTSHESRGFDIRGSNIQ